jgi:hypothetical protein
MKRDGAMAPTAVHGPSGITYHPIVQKTRSHLVNCVTKTMSNWWRLESKLCIASVDDTLFGKVTPSDIQKLEN